MFSKRIKKTFFVYFILLNIQFFFHFVEQVFKSVFLKFEHKQLKKYTNFYVNYTIEDKKILLKHKRNFIFEFLKLGFKLMSYVVPFVRKLS